MVSDRNSQATPPTRSLEARQVGEILQLLVRAQKTHRLYLGSNPITDRLEAELFTKFSAYLRSTGPVELSVREYQIYHDESVVYENLDGNESLAFLLFRDGIRRLTFLPELDREELHRFLITLNRVAVLINTEDDLVTLFWEQDFQAIRYFAIDELSDEAIGTQVSEQLSSGILESSSGGGGSPDQVSLAGLEQPVSQLPIESAQLSGDEIDALRAELKSEENEDFSRIVTELAIELTVLETSDEEQSKIAESLVGIFEQLVSEGELVTLLTAIDHLAGLAEMSFADSVPIQRLMSQVTQALSDPQRLGRILGQLERNGQLAPEQLQTFLLRLADQALPTLIPWLARLNKPAFRRSVSEVVLAAGPSCTEEILRQLRTRSDLQTKLMNSDFVNEILYIVRSSPGSSGVPVIEHILQVSSPKIRRVAAATLGHLRGRRAERAWLDLLEDRDARIRGLAATALARTGRRELAGQILQRFLRSSNTVKRELAEQERIFAVVGTLGGEQALSWFGDLLRPAKRRWFRPAKWRWFVPRREQELQRAAIHGIVGVGTERAEDLLRDLTVSADRFVRAACREALNGRRRNVPVRK